MLLLMLILHVAVLDWVLIYPVVFVYSQYLFLHNGVTNFQLF